MRVLILGFKDKAEVAAAMEKLIEESQCFLFTVVGGDRMNPAWEWAEDAGAPYQVLTNVSSPDKLLWKADYLVMKLETSSPQWMKNLMMKWKEAGKHGSVVR